MWASELLMGYFIFVLREIIFDNHVDALVFSIFIPILNTTHPHAEYFQISDHRSRQIFYIRDDQIDTVNNLENNEYSKFSQKYQLVD